MSYAARAPHCRASDCSRRNACCRRTLSTGEQQRVGIARALVNRPRLLLADEPTGNLDPELSRDIMRLFEQFQEVGTTVIIASHERELIAAMGKPIVELSHGALADATNDSGERDMPRLIRG